MDHDLFFSVRESCSRRPSEQSPVPRHAIPRTGVCVCVSARPGRGDDHYIPTIGGCGAGCSQGRLHAVRRRTSEAQTDGIADAGTGRACTYLSMICVSCRSYSSVAGWSCRARRDCAQLRSSRGPGPGALSSERARVSYQPAPETAARDALRCAFQRYRIVPYLHTTYRAGDASRQARHTRCVGRTVDVRSLGWRIADCRLRTGVDAPRRSARLRLGREAGLGGRGEVSDVAVRRSARIIGVSRLACYASTPPVSSYLCQHPHVSILSSASAGQRRQHLLPPTTSPVIHTHSTKIGQ